LEIRLTRFGSAPNDAELFSHDAGKRRTYTVANPAIAPWFQSTRPTVRVAELELLAIVRTTTHWRTHPKLKRRFLPEHPDDLQVIVHDGGPRITDRRPEAVWVTVNGCDGDILMPGETRRRSRFSTPTRILCLPITCPAETILGDGTAPSQGRRFCIACERAVDSIRRSAPCRTRHRFPSRRERRTICTKPSPSSLRRCNVRVADVETIDRRRAGPYTNDPRLLRTTRSGGLIALFTPRRTRRAEHSLHG